MLSAAANLTAGATLNRKKPNARYGPAQQQFILSTRSKIKAVGARFFEKKDWASLVPPGYHRNPSLTDEASLCVDSWYIKPIAAWIPHLLLPGFVPTCPVCESNAAVATSTYYFVDHPKILFGIGTHRYLDAVYYRCHDCDKRFTSYNEKSLELDGSKVIGLFNFRLSKGFAVDNELYSFIVSHSHDTTASIYEKLAHATADRYLGDSSYFYQAVRLKTVKARRPDVIEGTRQRTLDSILVPIVPCQLTRAEKRRKTLSATLAKAQSELRCYVARLEADVALVDLLKKKSNRNNLGTSFPGLGKQKIVTLLENDVSTVKELLHYRGSCRDILPQWKHIVREYYDNIRQQMRDCKEKVVQLQDDITLTQVVIDIEREEDGDFGDDPMPLAQTVTVDEEEPEVRLPPPFSDMTDAEKYNARCVSKSAIDRIVCTDHQHRGEVQDSKMRNLPASILKIDFSYKLPDKVYVHKGRGRGFKPFKCHASVQNEDALTVFWKFYPGAESFGVRGMKADLERLKERFDFLGCEIAAIYVDNCCHVRAQLQAIFPDAEIKLDEFHWHKRWDDVMCDPTSAEASIMRQLIKRAVFVVENSEYERAKEKLTRRKVNPPTVSEIMKEAKATIPPADMLKDRVSAMLRYVYHSDVMLELEKSRAGEPTTTAGGGPTRKPFLKPRTAEVLRKINNLMKHVCCGCLSDPASDKVNVHRINPVTEAVYTARSTGTNEVDNRLLNRILNHPTVGIARCCRIVGDHYEQTNDRKIVRRCGGTAAITGRTESLYLVNSLAKSAGYPDAELPLKVSYPPKIPIKEYIGLDFELPDAFKDDSVTEAANHTDGVEDLEDFLAGIDFVDEDVPVDTAQFADVADLDASIEPVDIAAIDLEVIRHLPCIRHNETTMETFTRLTRSQPWITFCDLKQPVKTASEEAELALFEQLYRNYDRFSKNLDGPKGYHRFAARWDMEVATSFKNSMEALDTAAAQTPIIRRKTVTQLQQHYDKCLAHHRIATLVREDDTFRSEFDATMRQTRRDMAPHQAAMNTAPPAYNHAHGLAPFGAPTALNINVAAGAVLYSPQRRGAAPFVLAQGNPNLNPKLDPRGGNFKRNKYCVVCGFGKKLHNADLGHKFGNLCCDNVGRQECSKCLWRLDLTLHANKLHGPHCKLFPHEHSEFKDWWKDLPANHHNSYGSADNNSNAAPYMQTGVL